MTAASPRTGPVTVMIDEAAIGGSVAVRLLLHASGLQVTISGAHSATLVAPTVGIFGNNFPPVPGCLAWYVGPGAAPAWMHGTIQSGPAATAHILRMLGTALVQEQAGAAFRAAGAGLPAPDRVDIHQAVLLGVDRAVCPLRSTSPVRSPAAIDPQPLLRMAFASIEACCAPNGAIAAAPMAEPGKPDYWFFWQRDGAATALALHAMSLSGPSDLRERAARRCHGYLEFIDRLGKSGSVTEGRTTVVGVPVGGYGDPQHDGPAATVLAVLTLDPAALPIARPFLEQLLRPEPRIGFDLWELVRGRSFHAANLRRRALRLAARVATGIDDALSRRCAVADERGDFDDPMVGWRHVRDPEPDWFRYTSGLDASVLGSALLAFDAESEINHPRLIRTAERLEAHYATRWPVNVAWSRSGNLGAGIGRFPEDANDGFGSTGGNPWPIATLWMAQYHLHRGNRDLAEGYLRFVVTHVEPQSISEQIDSVTGTPRGARGLAWANAELIVTLLALARAGTAPSCR